MSKWVMVALLLLQAHFAASFLLPLDAPSQREFGGLLRWVWPWSDGDGGPLGRIVTGGELPLPALWLALGAGTTLIAAALAAAGWWVPAAWLRPLATVGAALLLGLMALFLGPTKIMPAAFAALTLYVTLRAPAILAASWGGTA
jgi:hypothetical protein